MAISSENARVQAVIRKDVAEKIDELAKRMECSQSKMIAMLLDAAVDDNEWLIKASTSKFAQRIAAALGVEGVNGGEKMRRVAGEKCGTWSIITPHGAGGQSLNRLRQSFWVGVGESSPLPATSGMAGRFNRRLDCRSR